MPRGRRLYSWRTAVCLVADVCILVSLGGRLYVSWQTTVCLMADDSLGDRSLGNPCPGVGC